MTIPLQLSIVCCTCEAITAHYVVWGASHVEEVLYFCDNDCLMRWLLHWIVEQGEP